MLCSNSGIYAVNKPRLHSCWKKCTILRFIPFCPADYKSAGIQLLCITRWVSVWWPDWECSEKEHLLDKYLEMGLCLLNSMELLSGCCSRWSTARNPDCSSECPAAALLPEQVSAPRRLPSPLPAGYTQDRDSLCQEGLVSLHQLLAVSSPKQSLLPSQPNRTVPSHLPGLKTRCFFGCHCSTGANTQWHILSHPHGFPWTHQQHTSATCQTCQHKAHPKVTAEASTPISFASNSVF